MREPKKPPRGKRKVQRTSVALGRKQGKPPALLPTEATLKQLTNFAAIDMTYTEMSGCLCVDAKTLTAFRKRHPEVQVAIDKGYALGKMSLRRAQFDLAVKSKNATMMIWLGKNRLEQVDRVEHTGADAAPLIPPKIIVEFVDAPPRPPAAAPPGGKDHT